MRAYFKKADLILISILLLMSFAGIFLLHSGAGNTVTVRHNGEVLYSGALSKNQSITIDGNYQNILVIKDNTVYMEKSNCPGENCVLQGAISRAGSNIACAPNGVIITITSDEQEREVDAVAG